jgi:hypothetical protein
VRLRRSQDGPGQGQVTAPNVTGPAARQREEPPTRIVCKRGVIRALVACLLLLGCTPTGPAVVDASPAAQGTATPTTPVLPPLGDPAASPEDGSCRSEAELRAYLESFTRALNAGNVAALERSLSPVLLSVSAGSPSEPHWVVYGRTEALRELLRRHEAGERWRLVGLSQPTLRAWDGASHFGLQMERTLASGPVTHQGKGALFCHGRYEGIEVVALGNP